MEILRRLTKPVSHLVVLGLLALSLHLPAAQAGMIGTGTLSFAAWSAGFSGLFSLVANMAINSLVNTPARSVRTRSMYWA